MSNHSAGGASSGGAPLSATPAAPQGPLHGVRRLDHTTPVMAPFAPQLLGEMGAGVIKIEAPGGDTLRMVKIRPQAMARLPVWLGVLRS